MPTSNTLSGLSAFIAENAFRYKTILLVEGATDRSFFAKFIKDKEIAILPVDRLTDMPSQPIVGNIQYTEKSKCNNKNLILDIMWELRFSVPESIKGKSVYGVIDKDLGNRNDFCKKAGETLFVTDTYDLETLILSTDENAILSMGSLSILREEYNKALFLAYQLCEFRRIFSELACNSKNKIITCEQVGYLSENANTFREFDDILDDNNELRINLKKLIQYINTRIDEDNKNRIASGKPKSVCERISVNHQKELLNKCSSNTLCDNNGNWNKITYEQFCLSRPDDLWLITNGHDIMSALRWSGSQVRNYLRSAYPRNRVLESKLIAAYDTKKFYNTSIAKEMQLKGLLNPCE